jgi:flavin-dependent dehydrogenase
VQRVEQAPRVVTARVIVDATGQQALLANRLRLRIDDPRLRKLAIWTYYRGAWRDPGPNGGATVILHTQSKNTWFWSIPLREDITSVGVVGDADYLLKDRPSPSEAFEQQLRQCPALIERLKEASRVDGIRVAKEFSYSTRRQAGHGWVLVGDALGFIDPIYSSGVYFALKSGEMAGDAIVEGLRRGDTSAAQLGKWTGEFQAGTKWIRKLVDAFYTNQFSFGRFIKEHPHHLGNLTDLLIGRIFHDGAGRIFDDMTPVIAQAIAQPSRSGATT